MNDCHVYRVAFTAQFSARIKCSSQSKRRWQLNRPTYDPGGTQTHELGRFEPRKRHDQGTLHCVHTERGRLLPLVQRNIDSSGKPVLSTTNTRHTQLCHRQVMHPLLPFFTYLVSMRIGVLSVRSCAFFR